MFMGTHIAVPVLGTAALAWLYKRWHPLWAGFTSMDYVLVAAAAVLPDILDPHLYLSERITSTTHSIHFVIITAALWAVLLRRDPWLWIAMTAALGSHVALDACSGGVPLWAPWFPGVIGNYYIPERYWIPVEACSWAVLLAAWLWSTRNSTKEGKP